MNYQAETWFQYYKKLVDENPFLLSNRTVTNFLQISRSSETNSTVEERFGKLTNDNGDSIMLYAASGTGGKVHLLHSIYKIGGVNSSGTDETKLVALDGFKTSVAKPVIVDKGCIAAVLSVDAPLGTRLKSADTVEDLRKVEPPSSNGTTFKSRPYILLLPHLWEAAIMVQDKTPENMFLELKSRCEELEEESKEDKELVKSLGEYKTHLLTFLWAFVRDPEGMPTLTFHLPGEDDKNFDRWTHQRHLICISDKPRPPTSVEKLDGDADKLSGTDLIKAFEDVAARNKESTTTSTSTSRFETKIPFTTRRLIYNATTPSDCDETMQEASDCCKNFFNLQSITSAMHYFNHEMKNSFNSTMHHIAQECLSRIHMGEFLWVDGCTPSAFSLFNFQKRKPVSIEDDDDNSAPDLMFLKIKQDTTGKLSNEEIKSLMKKGCKCATTVEELKCIIDIACKVGSFFFTKESELVIALNELYNLVCDNQLIYEQQAGDDHTFVVKFMFAVDTRIQMWLNSCGTNTARRKVSDSIIDFEELCMNVVLRDFSITLPKVFVSSIDLKKKDGGRKRDTPGGGRSPGGGGGKKPKLDADDNYSKNENTNEKWLVEKSVYSKFLKSPKLKKDVPKLDNGKRMCCKWLSNGYCFNDCNRAYAHIDYDDMSKKEKAAYDSFIGAVKKKSGEA